MKSLFWEGQMKMVKKYKKSNEEIEDLIKEAVETDAYPSKLKPDFIFLLDTIKTLRKDIRLVRAQVDLQAKEEVIVVEDVPQALKNLNGKLARPNLAAARGIYFLSHKAELVYIGQCTDVYDRPYKHDDKEYDDVLFMKEKAENLTNVEYAFIRHWLPKYNKDTSGGDPSKDAEILAYYLNEN